MSNNYFDKFPKTSVATFGELNVSSFISTFPVKSKTTSFSVSLTDIFVKAKVLNTVLEDATAYYPYIWKNQDRPDTVAKKYYGDEKFFWLVFFSNGAFDLKMDFPMPEVQFRDYLWDKYSEDTDIIATPLSDKSQIYTALNGVIHHYETNDDLKLEIKFDSNDPLQTPVNAISYYTYEERINERNRTIKLISKEYASSIDYELRKLLSDI